MAQISVGKLLPNLKVTLGNDATENEYSIDKDYEFSEKEKETSNNPNVEIVRSWMESLQNPKIYKNKSGGFTTGLDLISEDNTEILGKRAERFGLEKEESSLAPNISLLYESMGISIENRNSAKMKNIRLDSLHMRGVNDLNTNEIFHYFRDYGAASVEWINDFSCNVVWLDEASCARALLGMSKPLPKTDAVEETDDLSKDPDAEEGEIRIEDEESPTLELSDDKDEITMDVDDDSKVKSSSKPSVTLDIPVPPGHWRLGIPHPKAKTILLRFATKDDKKLPGAEKRSNYYKKYGNPNYGGLKGLISGSRKRKIQAAVNRKAIIEKGSRTESTSSLDDLHSDVPKSNPKPPRMRMYADDEELKTRKIWSDDNFSEKQQSVHSRLGSKYTKDDLCHLGNSFYRGSDRDGERRRETRERMSRELDDDYELDSESAFSLKSSARRDRKRNWPSRDQVDLRTKLKRLRSDNIDRLKKSDDVKKHRSPLCADVDDSDSDD